MNGSSKLLVIGNGFDLTSNAKTSYSDFFNSDYYSETRSSVNAIIEKYEKTMSIAYKDIHNCNFNCWDLLFCAEAHYNNDQETHTNRNWCDIERLIHDTLVDKINFGKNLNFSWKRVFFILKHMLGDQLPRNYFVTADSVATKIMVTYLSYLQDPTLYNENSFYEWLLNELKKFEISFGKYILSETKSSDYIIKAFKLISIITDSTEKLSVDSFNYSSIPNSIVQLRHINGDTSHPIFGIDLTYEEESNNPALKCFTKTSRRISQDTHNLNQSTDWNSEVITHAIVFGHSLNEMDYDYFNYLFTKLKFNTFEVEKMGSIEFLYRIYDENKATSIRDDYADSVYKLINYYEEYVSNSNQHILINLLRFSGKLIIRELII